MITKEITEKYQHKINITKSGLVAISISARCKSKKQLKSNTDEDLRIEIDGVYFRENFPQKNIQRFNIPVAFNGTKLKGLKKTIIILVVLDKGEHVLNLIPKNSAYLESIKIQEFATQDVEFILEDQAEDGNNRPWYTFVLVDLPLSKLSTDVTVQKRFWDSDDVKIIVNDKIKKNISGGKYKFWYFVGGILGWVTSFVKGKSQRQKISFRGNLDDGVHYLEFWADRMPILHNVKLNLKYTETRAEKRAIELIREYVDIIKRSAKKFDVDATMVGAVIYQEQSTNVNFVDTLIDYVGGLLGINTSIGIGQVRVKTAESLEKIYQELKISCDDNKLIDCNSLRVECLKMPLLNIRYVAAKIKFSQDRWEKAGININNRSEIVGTLYNIEDVDKPIEPHLNPEANDFGDGVGQNFNKIKEIFNP
ncbi:hypothetical protein D4R87_03210 [bacterium]|nr:MAG: hypothetical protein D4R87_03210 [bacterium]